MFGNDQLWQISTINKLGQTWFRFPLYWANGKKLQGQMSYEKFSFLYLNTTWDTIVINDCQQIANTNQRELFFMSSTRRFNPGPLQNVDTLLGQKLTLGFKPW